MADYLTDTNVGNTDYIRRQDMLNAVEKLDIIPSVDGMGIPTGAEDFRVQFLGTVLKVEPADVAPVRHGKWTHKPDVYGVVYCSECNYELHANSTSFCPNCGAKMDREE